MIFLIEYNRIKGKLVTVEKFADAEVESARQARLSLELDLHQKGIGHEVVLLDAKSEAALRRTHRRYFEDLSQLIMATPLL